MKYWLTESKPRYGRKDLKIIHSLAECETLEDARELTRIWINLSEQQGRYKQDFLICDENSQLHALEKPPLDIWGGW